jgi:DNA-binding transcriptional LysR family regulator
VRELLESYRQGLDQFAGYQSGLRRQVTFAALPSVAAVVVVAGFLQEHPAVHVRVADGSSEQVLAVLREGGADLAIEEVGPASAGLAFQPLVDDPLVAVLPRGHALAELARLAWADLAGEPFIAFGPSSSIRCIADLGLAQAGVEARVRMEAETVAMVGGMICARLGLSVTPEFGASPDAGRAHGH